MEKFLRWEAQIRQGRKKLAELQNQRQFLKEEVTEHDIARVVASLDRHSGFQMLIGSRQAGTYGR